MLLTNAFANAFFSLIIKDMSQTGSVWAGLLGLQTARFDLLEAYSNEQSKYVNIAAEIDALVAASMIKNKDLLILMLV